MCYCSDGSVDMVVQTEDIPARITRRHLEPTEMLKVKATGENPAETHAVLHVTSRRRTSSLLRISALSNCAFVALTAVSKMPVRLCW